MIYIYISINIYIFIFILILNFLNKKKLNFNYINVLLDKFKVITIEPKYIEPKYIELYKLIYEKCFTYNLHERITMDEFIRLYNNIVS
jgi:hypothetical protein